MSTKCFEFRVNETIWWQQTSKLIAFTQGVFEGGNSSSFFFYLPNLLENILNFAKMVLKSVRIG